MGLTYGQGGANAATACQVAPAGRAASMPLAAVLTVPSGQQGQRKGGLELHSSPTSQVMIAHELA
jgi:hypothetical protein